MNNTHRVFFDKDKNEDMEKKGIDPGTIYFRNAEINL